MKSCKKCAVTVAGNHEQCPLCRNTLVGEGDAANETFPFVPIVKYEHSLLYRLLQLGSAAAVISALAVNRMLPRHGFWSLFVVAGVACLWIMLSIAVRKRHHILKNVSYQVTIISILSVLWDVFTGWHGWSIDFVIPIAFVAAMCATTILARILKMHAEEYIIYLSLLILYGIIPIVFLLFDWNKIVLPSLICVAVSAFSLAALFILDGGNMVEELKRRMHL